MAIAKLNKTFKNKGEPGYEENPINKQLMQEMCDKTDEVIDEMTNAGTYLLSGGINRYEGDIDLNNSINNYDYLICAVGSVGDGSYVHTRMMPFATQYANGQNTRGLWRINTDIPVALTVNGSISFEIVTEKKLRIKTNASNTPVRAIYGVKLS